MPDSNLTLRTSGPEQTQQVGAAIARSVLPGDAISLSGELGAGKTCLVQGAARQLGVTSRVTSPTFMLVRLYEARVPIVHCDVYRLDTVNDVLDLGDEVLAADAVTFIEWGDAIAALLPDDRLEIDLKFADETGVNGERIIVLRASGNWLDRLAGVSDACASWRDGGA